MAELKKDGYMEKHNLLHAGKTKYSKDDNIP